ncbi:50S ribosomal protein L23 [Candidatus Babeliales bacterium]|nr:50S ribosomal protein L23 [Candidatus Babeliales bacterium]
MKLSAYDIIKKRIITPKTVDLFRKLKQITFQVHKEANKIMIREAVEKIWDVKVDKVRVISCPGKKRVFARMSFQSPDTKKAIVFLKKGYKIDLPGNFETMGVAEQEETLDKKEMNLEGK